MATIFLSSRENSILSLVEHPQAFSARSLALISVSFFLLMVVSFGAAFPGGIFMPTIVVGCTFGALFGRFAKYLSCLLDQVDGGCMAHNPFGQSEHGGSGMRLDDVGFSPHLENVIQHTGPYALLGAVGLVRFDANFLRHVRVMFESVSRHSGTFSLRAFVLLKTSQMWHH